MFPQCGINNGILFYFILHRNVHLCRWPVVATDSTQFLFPVVYLCHIRLSVHQCFYGFSLCFVASLFVFCLVTFLLLISSLHLKAPEGSQCKQHNPVKSCRCEWRAHYQDKQFKVVKQPLNNYIVWQWCYTAPSCKTTKFSSFPDCRLVATPLASLLGVKEKTRVKAAYIPTLESHYCKITKNPTKVEVTKKKKHDLHLWLDSWNKKSVMFAPSDFDSESLPANGIHGKTSAAMVPETKEPGQAKLAQKVSGSQVSTDLDAHS